MTRCVLSLVVAGVLALQAAASFGLSAALTGRGPNWLWPFLDYPMYSRAHYEGEALDLPAVVGLRADGREVEVRPVDLGVNFWRFHGGVVESLRRGDPTWLVRYADLYRVRHGVPLVRLTLESRPLVLEREGVRRGARSVVASIDLPPAR